MTAAAATAPTLHLIAADDAPGLLERLEARLAEGPKASAGAVVRPPEGVGRQRVAIIAGSSEELGERGESVREALRDGPGGFRRVGPGAFAGAREAPPRLGFLFSGQAAPVRPRPGALGAFPGVDDLYHRSGLDAETAGDEVPRADIQRAIVAASLAGLRILRALGLEADAALGHSLGELTALHWAEAIDEDALLRVVQVRGAAMAKTSNEGGMAGLGTDAETAERLTDGLGASIACFNAPDQQIVSGSTQDLKVVLGRARENGIRGARLPVTGAFHSELMRPALKPLTAELEATTVKPPQRRVVSTVSGEWIDASVDIRAMLHDQLLSPVRFVEAVRLLAEEADLLIEVGPGTILAGLAAKATDVPAVSVDAAHDSYAGLLEAAGAAFAAGASLAPGPLTALEGREQGLSASLRPA